MLNLIDGNAGNLPRLIIVSLALSSGLLIVLIILEVVAFKFVYELILVTTRQHFIYNITPLDRLLFIFYPMLTGTFFYYFDRSILIKQLIRINFLVFLGIFIFLIFGVIIGLYVWTSGRDFLPDNLLI